MVNVLNIVLVASSKEKENVMRNFVKKNVQTVLFANVNLWIVEYLVIFSYRWKMMYVKINVIMEIVK